MRLRTKIILFTSLIVISLGVLTIGAINTVVANKLSNELDAHGSALVQISGNAIANALLEGDMVAVQEFLQYLKGSNPSIIYAYAIGAPGRVVVHTFASGFPVDLLTANTMPAGQLTQQTLLRTEAGIIQDFGWRLTDKLDIELHLGFSQTGITDVLQELTWIIFGLTVAGMMAGVVATIAFARVVTRPLSRLTEGVQRFGAGDLTQTIAINNRDEIGDLARAFNSMAVDLQGMITQLQDSRAGYRALLKAAGQVGEGIALICDEVVNEGSFLFVNDEFCRLTGYERTHLLNLNAAEVIHPNSLNAAFEAWQTIRDGKSAALRHEMQLLTRDRRAIIVETSGTIIQYEGKRALAWFTRDITERKEKEAEIQRQNRELAALNAISAIMNRHSSNIEHMLQEALEQVLAVLDLPAGWIVIAHENSPPHLAAVAGFAEPPAQLGVRFPECDCGLVLRTQSPIIVTPGHNCILAHSHSSSGKPVHCHTSVPLIGGGRVIGALNVAAHSPAFFTEENFRLMVMIGSQLGVALENARLWNDLKDKERLRAQLLAKAIRAQEEERKRIARELHDEFGQSLNALIFGLKTAELALTDPSMNAGEILKRLRVSTSDAVRELQTVIYDLRPSLLDDLGLLPAIRWYAESRLEKLGIKVIWEIEGDDKVRFAPDIETALFRIAQEALTNISKYAEASEVKIKMQAKSDRVVLEIHDNGKGFDLANVLEIREREGRGLGLLGIRERADLLSGSFHLESQVGRGTCVRAEIPLTIEHDVRSHHPEETSP